MLHCSFLFKRRSYAKLGSIIPCIVAEGMSRAASGSLIRFLWQLWIMLGLCGSLGHASGLLRLFFFFLPASSIFSAAIHAPFLWECAILLSFDCPYITPVRVIFVNDGGHLHTINCKSRVLFYYFIFNILYFIFRNYNLTATLSLNQFYFKFPSQYSYTN